MSNPRPGTFATPGARPAGAAVPTGAASRRVEPMSAPTGGSTGVGASRPGVGAASAGGVSAARTPGFGAASASAAAARPSTISASRPGYSASAGTAPRSATMGARPYGAPSSMSQGLDVRKAIASYFDRVISAVQGMKVVLFDDDTKGMVSMVYTQSQILEKSVFLTASLVPKKKVIYDSSHDDEIKTREKMMHLKGVVVCRPNETNVDEIVREIDNPLYGEYHLFFTSPVHPTVLSRIAQADRNSVVKQVQEFYIDYLAVNSDLFEFGLEDYMRLSRSRAKWNSQMESMFRRSIQGTMAVLLSLRQKPTVRYQAGSELAQLFARELSHEMDRERQMFEFGNTAPPSNSSGETLLLVLDRREDPVTPLLLQWTYQAMVHDLVGGGLKNNIVDLGQGFIDRNPDDEDSDPRKQLERRTIVLSQAEDFYSKNMFKDYGILAQNTKRMLDDYKETVAQNKNISTIEDMTRVVENMPEFKKLANNALKHAAVVGEISRIIGERHLIDVSTLEQSLACSSDHAQHVEKVKEKIRDQKIAVEDKLRLALLYTLRYETHGGNRIPEIKQLLRAAKITEDRVKLLDLILDYAGTAKRTKEVAYGAGSELFTGFVTMVKSVSQVSGVENALTQHKPVLAKILEDVRTGKLSENKFPSATSSGGSGMGGYPGPSSSPIPGGMAGMAPPAREVIVLILGGTTYEEAAYVATLNSLPPMGTNPPFKVLLGGTAIVNTHMFLKELGSLSL